MKETDKKAFVSLGGLNGIINPEDKLLIRKAKREGFIWLSVDDMQFSLNAKELIQAIEKIEL